MDIHIGVKRSNLAVTAERLRRVAHPLRLAVLQLLRERRELCVCAIAEALSTGQATLSRHLRILKDGDLVRARRDGPNVYYSLDDETLAGLNHTVGGLSRSRLVGREIER